MDPGPCSFSFRGFRLVAGCIGDVKAATPRRLARSHDSALDFIETPGVSIKHCCLEKENKETHAVCGSFFPQRANEKP